MDTVSVWQLCGDEDGDQDPGELRQHFSTTRRRSHSPTSLHQLQPPQRHPVRLSSSLPHLWEFRSLFSLWLKSSLFISLFCHLRLKRGSKELLSVVGTIQEFQSQQQLFSHPEGLIAFSSHSLWKDSLFTGRLCTLYLQDLSVMPFASVHFQPLCVVMFKTHLLQAIRVRFWFFFNAFWQFLCFELSVYSISIECHYWCDWI